MVGERSRLLSDLPFSLISAGLIQRTENKRMGAAAPLSANAL